MTFLSLYLCYCTEVAEVVADLPDRCSGHDARVVVPAVPEQPGHAPMELGHDCPDSRRCADHRTSPSREKAAGTEPKESAE